METIITLLGQQAQELMNNSEVRAMLNNANSEEERMQLLAIASMHSLIKANL